MTTTQTSRPAKDAATPRSSALAGSTTPAPTRNPATPISAPSGRDQAARPTKHAASPKVASSAGPQTSASAIDPPEPNAGPLRRDQTPPQAIQGSMPRLAAPAGTKTGRDQPSNGTHAVSVSAPNFPGDQGVCDAQDSAVAGDQDQPTAIELTSPILPSPSAASPPPAAKIRAVPTDLPPQVGDSFLVLAAEVVDDLEAVRKANVNRLRQLTRAVADSDGAERGFGLTLENPDVARLAAMVQSLLCDDKLLIKELGVEKRRKTAGCCLEHDAIRNLERLMRANPLGPWVKTQTGIGDKQAARLLGAVGDPYIRPELTHEDGTVEPSRPRTVSELWAYCGYKPGQRRRKGIKSNWSAVAKSRAYLIAQAMLKAGNREVYDARKAATEGRLHAEECVRCGPSGKPAQPGSPWSAGHRHADALRVVSKAVLKELWHESKRLHEGDA